MKTGTEKASPSLKREDWMDDKERFYHRKTDSIRAKTESNTPCPASGVCANIISSPLALGYPGLSTLLPLAYVASLRLPHSVPAALLRKCPMFPAFPISWGLHWLLSITFIAWHTGHSEVPWRDYWQEQETDTTSQWVLRYRTQKVTKKMSWLKAGHDPVHSGSTVLAEDRRCQKCLRKYFLFPLWPLRRGLFFFMPFPLHTLSECSMLGHDSVSKLPGHFLVGPMRQTSLSALLSLIHLCSKSYRNPVD